MTTIGYKPRILAVEDNAPTRQLIRTVLEHQYTILEAAGGREALQILEDEDPPDLILLDIMMPEMDGYEVFAEIRKTPRIADIPIIFVTALDGKIAELKGLKFGAVDYIAKPFDKEVLVARIETALELHNYSKPSQDGFPDLPTEFYQPDSANRNQLKNMASSETPRLLVVDDDNSTLRLIETGLGSEYEVVSFGTARDTLHFLENEPQPDLILMNVTLSDLGGFEFIGQLKKTEKNAFVPVIFISAQNKSSDEIRAFKSGAVDYVQKPVDLPILKARILNQLTLDRRRKQFEDRMEDFETD